MKETIKFAGFNRVIINQNYKLVTESQALELGIKPVIGFLELPRSFSIGAPNQDGLEFFAYWSCKKYWTHFILAGDKFWRPIEEYPHHGEYELDTHRGEFLKKERELLNGTSGVGETEPRKDES